MPPSPSPLVVDRKLALFRTCFTGLTHVYGTYDQGTGRVRQAKEPVTDRVLLRHLSGQQPYGVYLLMEDRTRAVVADFDEDDPWPPLQFVHQARHYGIRSYVERSKSKGWHAWVFLELPGVSAAKARLVVQAILDDIDQTGTEVFPKQDRLGDGNRFGSFINAPLFGRLVPAGRTVFVDPERGFVPYPDQWAVLGSVQRVPEALLDSIIEINQLVHASTGCLPAVVSPFTPKAGRSFGLPPCAQQILSEGVSEYQRVACFRLAVNLKKAGRPYDWAVACLNNWAQKNRPAPGKRIITPTEIAQQAHDAYAKPYRSCGCEEPIIRSHCQKSCRLRRNRDAPV